MVNYNKTAVSARLLGVDPYLASAGIAGSKLSLVESVAPYEVRKQAVLSALRMGLSTLKWLADWQSPFNITGKLRAVALQRQVSSGRSLPLIFPQEDIGFRYRGGAVVQHISRSAPPSSPHGQTSLRRQLEMRVGGRLPHFWLMSCDSVRSGSSELSPEENCTGSFFSSLDLAGRCGAWDVPKALLLVGEDFAREAASAVDSLSSSSLSGVFRVVAIRDPKASDYAAMGLCEGEQHIRHETLQRSLQSPRHSGVDDVDGREDEEHHTHWVQRRNVNFRLLDSLSEVVDIVGSWKEMVTRESDPLSVVASLHKCVVLRPDGHIAALLSVNTDDSETARIDSFKFVLSKAARSFRALNTC